MKFFISALLLVVFCYANSYSSSDISSSNNNNLIVIFEFTMQTQDSLDHLKVSALKIIHEFREINQMTNYVLVVCSDPSPKVMQHSRDKSQFLENIEAAFRSDSVVKGIADEFIEDFFLPDAVVLFFTMDDYGKAENKKTYIDDLIYKNQLHVFNYISDDDGWKKIGESREFESEDFSESKTEEVTRENPLLTRRRRFLSPEVHGFIENDSSQLYNKIQIWEGSSFTLACKVNFELPTNIWWHKQGNSTYLKEARSEQQLYYTIDNAEVAQSGTYVCSCRNHIENNSVQIDVIVKYAPLTIKIPVKIVHPVEGTESIILQCQSHPERGVEFQWTFNGGSEELPEGYTILGSNLTLNNIHRKMNGVYTCTGTRRNESMSDTVKLDVYYPTKIVSINMTTDAGTREIYGTADQINIYNTTKLSIDCLAEGQPLPEVAWTHNGVPKSTMSNLYFDIFHTSDSGHYTCFADNGHSAVDKHDISLNFIVAPKMKQGYRSYVTLQKGESLNMACPVEELNDDVMVSWWTNEDTRLTYNVDGDGHLSTPSVDKNMRGKFYCLAENKAGISRANFEFIIKFPPKIFNIQITKDGSPSNFSAGIIMYSVANITSLEIACDVEGYPTPKIQWYKNSFWVLTGKKISIDPKVETSSGNFKCVAENYLGTHKIDVLLDVVLPLTISQNYTKLQTLVEGLKFNLSCPVDGRIGEVVWMMNSEPVAEYTKDKSLLIEAPSGNMSGSAECIASNIAGATKAEFNFDVLFRPEILDLVWESHTQITNTDLDQQKYSMYVFRKQRLNLTCTALGNPTPTITWSKNGKYYDRGNVLLIPSVNLEDAGIYECMACNAQGQSAVVIDVKVKEKLGFKLPGFQNLSGLHPVKRTIDNKITEIDVIAVEPSFLVADFEKQESIFVAEGHRFYLNCTMTEGHQKINYSWMKNGNPLYFHKQVLIRRSALVNDTGIYRCDARNELNSISVVYYVYVQDFPQISRYKTRVVVTNGDNVQLSCQSRGHFLPLMEWRDSKSKLLASNSFLFSQNHSTEDWSSIESVIRGEQLISIQKNEIIPNNPKPADIYGVLNYETFLGRTVGNFQLHINQIQRTQKRRFFTCLVQEAGVKVEISTEIIVNVRPYSSQDQHEERTIVQGSIAILECDIKGYPGPNIIWYKDNVELRNFFSLRIHASYNYKMLTLFNPNVNDSGEYKCVGTNNAGSYYRIISLSVVESI